MEFRKKSRSLEGDNSWSNEREQYSRREDEGGTLEMIWEVMWLNRPCKNVGPDSKAEDLTTQQRTQVCPNHVAESLCCEEVKEKAKPSLQETDTQSREVADAARSRNIGAGCFWIAGGPSLRTVSSSPLWRRLSPQTYGERRDGPYKRFGQRGALK